MSQFQVNSSCLKVCFLQKFDNFRENLLTTLLVNINNATTLNIIIILITSTQDLQQQSRNSLLTSILGLGFWLLTFVQKEGGKKREKLPFRVGWRSMMIDNCLLVIIYRRGHILEFSVTAESISRSQDCLSVKSCVDTVICNLKLRENAILTFAPIRNIWIKTREPRLKKLICVKILTCQKWNLGEILTSHSHDQPRVWHGRGWRYVEERYLCTAAAARGMLI